VILTFDQIRKCAVGKTSNGTEFLVDLCDVHRVLPFSWCSDSSGYLVARVDGKNRRLHRWLFDDVPPSLVVDHANGNKLDCRRSNLRFATRAQNGQNARLSKRNTTGLKGVCWNASRQLFAAEIRCSGQRHHLGRFATADQAKDARDRAAVALHGEFARSA
jgi:hypothetical protein